MRKVQLKKLLEVCTLVAGDFIRRRIDVDGWTAKEIYEASGVTQNRLTELQNLEKYNRPINEKTLGLLISGGVFNVDELNHGVSLKKKVNQEESKFLGALRLYENKALKEKSLKVMEAGGDPAKILDAWLKKSK